MRTLAVLLPVLVAILVGAAPATAWTWPVDGPVLQAFELGDDPYAGGQHRGVDIAAASGDPVRAPAAGTVTFAGSVPTGGRTVTIETPSGHSVTLLHLGTIDVGRGTSVAEGDVVATVGRSGAVEHAVPYVHLGVRVTSQPEGYVDPLALLNGSAAPETAADAEASGGTPAAPPAAETNDAPMPDASEVPTPGPASGAAAGSGVAQPGTSAGVGAGRDDGRPADGPAEESLLGPVADVPAAVSVPATPVSGAASAGEAVAAAEGSAMPVSAPGVGATTAVAAGEPRTDEPGAAGVPAAGTGASAGLLPGGVQPVDEGLPESTVLAAPVSAPAVPGEGSNAKAPQTHAFSASPARGDSAGSIARVAARSGLEAGAHGSPATARGGAGSGEAARTGRADEASAATLALAVLAAVVGGAAVAWGTVGLIQLPGRRDPYGQALRASPRRAMPEDVRTEGVAARAAQSAARRAASPRDRDFVGADRGTRRVPRTAPAQVRASRGATPAGARGVPRSQLRYLGPDAWLAQWA